MADRLSFSEGEELMRVMCGTKAPQLFPRKVGQVDFMICANCKGIMDM